MSDEQKADFLHFEGNAQTFRLVTKLQLLNDNFGLNLTYGTLSTMLKYVVPSSRMAKTSFPGTKKPGYFFSETRVAREVQGKTGTGEFRNPLAYIVEACDDIAYSVLDAEDAAKKGLVSFADLVARLKAKCGADPVAKSVLKSAKSKHAGFQKATMSPAELDDISMQMFRVFAIQEMVRAVTSAFVKNVPAMLGNEFHGDLVTASDGVKLCEALKGFDQDYAYKNREVLGIELTGHHIIQGIMTLLWEAITERKGGSLAKTARSSPFANYAFGRISENYRRVFSRNVDGLPQRYRELQLLTDMVSGMTDSYAVDFYQDLKRRRNEP